MKKIVEWFSRLIEPEHSIEDEEIRYKSRFLSSLFVFILPFGFFLLVFTGLIKNGPFFFLEIDFIGYTFGILLWVLSYLLSKKGNIKAATILATGVGCLTIFFSAIFDKDGGTRELAFLIFPIFIASTILTAWETTFLAAIVLGLSFLTPWINASSSVVSVLVGPVTFQLIGFLLILLSNRYRDILENFRNNELTQHETRYRTLFQEGYGGLCIVINDKIVEVNEGLEFIFGYEASEIVGMPFSTLFLPEFHGKLNLDTFSSNQPIREVIGIRKNGTTLFVEILPSNQTYNDLSAQVIAIRDTTRQVEDRDKYTELSNQFARSNTLLRTLNNVSSKFAASANSDEVFEILGAELRELDLNIIVVMVKGAQQNILLKYFSVGKEIIAAAEKMINISLSDFILPREKWLPEMKIVLEEGQPMFVHDFYRIIGTLFPRLPDALVRPAAKKINITKYTSAYYLPLQTKDELIGSLTIWGDNLPKHELQTYSVFATMVANAYEKARLYEHAQIEIDERKKAQEALEISREEYRGLFENAHDAIIILDPETERVLNVNEQACQVYGFDRQAFEGMDLSQISEDVTRGKKHIALTMEGGKYHYFETAQFRSDGSRMELEINASIVDFNGKRAIQSINRDVTERKAYERKLQHDALHDGLTNLPNRDLLMNRLDHAIARLDREAKFKFAILFIDLDRFKKINDSLGHLVGDRFLVQISHRLQSTMRGTDLVARLGGDEFVILLEGISSPMDAVAFCERIMQVLSEPVILDKNELVATASIGLVMSDPKYLTSEAYLRDADIAMYRAKSLGKSRYEIFDESMHAEVLKTLDTEIRIRQALQNEEFFLVYQPIVKVKTFEITGYEVLLRWRASDNEILGPGEFIPVAEESGLILEVGRWVLYTACKQFREWQDIDPNFKNIQLNVNVSGIELLQIRFPDTVKNILEITNLDPKYLAIEITETALITETDAVERTLEKLTEIGVDIHLDDFGTGYSSLSFLTRFPIAAIKIDRKFILGIDEARNIGLIRSLNSLGRELGLKVIAEGIESGGQLSKLKEIGIEMGQGYFYSRPTTAMDVIKRSNPLPNEKHNNGY